MTNKILTKEIIISKLQEKYDYLLLEYGVKRIGLFGSYIKNMPTETSDIDIVIEFERPIGFKFMQLNEYLENLLGKKVDILTPTGIQNIRLDYVAKDIQASIFYV